MLPSLGPSAIRVWITPRSAAKLHRLRRLRPLHLVVLRPRYDVRAVHGIIVQPRHNVPGTADSDLLASVHAGTPSVYVHTTSHSAVVDEVRKRMCFSTMSPPVRPGSVLG